MFWKSRVAVGHGESPRGWAVCTRFANHELLLVVNEIEVFPALNAL